MLQDKCDQLERVHKTAMTLIRCLRTQFIREDKATRVV